MKTKEEDRKTFYIGLKENNVGILDQVPKSDLHCHSDRGTYRKDIEEELDVVFNDPPVFKSIEEMDAWYDDNIDEFVKGYSGIVRRYKSLFKTAEDQNIKVFSPSFCLGKKKYFGGSVEEYIAFLNKLKEKYAPSISFYPELVLNRHADIKQIEEEFEEAKRINFFKSIDIIGDEFLGTEKFKEIYQDADKLGWILKAHVGEFGGVDLMEEAIENLNLDVINHGISAIDSPNMMHYLKTSGIRLNVCPTSNLLLSRVKSYREHPIGRFVREGIICSINTDDLLIFNQTVSNEYLNLYNSNTLSLEELNKIREDGLTKFLIKRKK